jgi:hypothetical protein
MNEQPDPTFVKLLSQSSLGTPEALEARAVGRAELAKHEEQIRHYREIANEAGYCGDIVYSHYGDVEGPCAREVGHEGRCRP